jgi:hypothetical protein
MRHKLLGLRKHLEGGGSDRAAEAILEELGAAATPAAVR